MATTSFRHVIGQAELNTAVCGGILRGNFGAGITAARDGVSGEVYSRHAMITEIKPTGNWETYHLKTWLSQVGVVGASIDDLAAGLKVYLRQAQHGGTIASGSVHTKYTMRSGVIVPGRLSVDGRRPATLEYNALASYDGANAAVGITEDVALPGTFADDERFGIGPVTLESISFTGVTRLEIDFGLRAEGLGPDGSVYDTEISIIEVRPQLTIRGVNPSWFGASSVPLDGLAIGHTNTTIYLRRYKHGSTFEANNQAKHLKLTVDGMAYLENLFDGQHPNAAETSLVIPLEYDGTNEPIVVSVDSQIT